MKNLLALFALFTMLAGAWISVFGMLILSSHQESGLGISISGAIIFAASLISLTMMSLNKRD